MARRTAGPAALTPLPPATGARKDALQKKKQLFRERIRRRNEQRLAAGEEEIERDSDDSGDGGDQQEDREEVVAAVEAEMLGVLGGANISSQREAWPEVIRRDASRTGLLTRTAPQPHSSHPFPPSTGDRRRHQDGAADAKVERPPPLHRRRHPAPRAPAVAQDGGQRREPRAIGARRPHDRRVVRPAIMAQFVATLRNSLTARLPSTGASPSSTRRSARRSPATAGCAGWSSSRGKTRPPTSLCAPPSASSSPTGRRGTAEASTRGRRCSRARGTHYPRGCGCRMAPRRRAGRRRRAARRRRRGWCCWAPRRSTCRRAGRSGRTARRRRRRCRRRWG